MTRQEAMKKWHSVQTLNSELFGAWTVSHLINEIFNDFEKNYEPKQKTIYDYSTDEIECTYEEQKKEMK